MCNETFKEIYDHECSVFQRKKFMIVNVVFSMKHYRYAQSV